MSGSLPDGVKEINDFIWQGRALSWTSGTPTFTLQDVHFIGVTFRGSTQWQRSPSTYGIFASRLPMKSMVYGRFHGRTPSNGSSSYRGMAPC